MNKLMLELRDQAIKYAVDNQQSMDVAMEKFAELIIQECINEIHVADIGDLKGKGYYLDKVAEHVEKQLGVE